MKHPTTILVTGGAGYIGSHVCKALAKAGYNPVAYDNLCNGHPGLVKWGVLEQGDTRDIARLQEVFSVYSPKAVVHMAAHIAAGESVTDPGKYYHNNSYGSLVLLETMREAGVKHMVFSSTAAVYGNPKKLPIKEIHPLAPINPYGASKLMTEQMLQSYQEAYGLSSVALRYFNAIGADKEGEAGCVHRIPDNLVPIIMEVLRGTRDQLQIFGNDYDTEDGTPVRDYIHVSDLADAHVKALDHLFKGGKTIALNLGTGRGHSVHEVVKAVEKVTGRKIKTAKAPRRAGDPPRLVADAAKAKKLLKWQPTYTTLEEMIATVWQWETHGRNAL